MMKRIVWGMADGSIRISTVPEDYRLDSESESEYLDRVAHLVKAKLCKLDSAYEVAERLADISIAENEAADRRFRDAWKWNQGESRIEVDVDKARLLTKQRIRAERRPLLAALDIAFV